MTNNVHLFYIDSAESKKEKTVPLKFGQRMVFCLNRDLEAYTL